VRQGCQDPFLICIKKWAGKVCRFIVRIWCHVCRTVVSSLRIYDTATCGGGTIILHCYEYKFLNTGIAYSYYGQRYDVVEDTKTGQIVDIQTTPNR